MDLSVANVVEIYEEHLKRVTDTSPDKGDEVHKEWAWQGARSEIAGKWQNENPHPVRKEDDDDDTFSGRLKGHSKRMWAFADSALDAAGITKKGKVN
jgi:hypothetical protein